MTSFAELCYWNNKKYGKVPYLSKWKIRSIMIGAGIVVPVLIPLPLMVLLAAFVRKDFVWRN